MVCSFCVEEIIDCLFYEGVIYVVYCKCFVVEDYCYVEKLCCDYDYDLIDDLL